MGREVKRVPADFSWPYKVWQGYLMPDELRPEPCRLCEGGGLNPATTELSENWYDHDGFVYLGSFSDRVTDEEILRQVKLAGGRYTYRYGKSHDGKPAERPPWRIIGKSKQWMHEITQDEVQALVDEGRLCNFTHVWKGGEGWVRREDGYIPTAAEVNEWSQHGFGHDAINRRVCVETRAKRLGIYGKCEHCNGEGHTWNSAEQKQKHDAWERTEPPEGPAYQIWETVSEGSPVSPPFLNPEDLARWMVDNDDSVTKDTDYAGWLTFITRCNYAPSVIRMSNGMYSGVSGVVAMRSEE